MDHLQHPGAAVGLVSFIAACRSSAVIFVLSAVKILKFSGTWARFVQRHDNLPLYGSSKAPSPGRTLTEGQQCHKSNMMLQFEFACGLIQEASMQFDAVCQSTLESIR